MQTNTEVRWFFHRDEDISPIAHWFEGFGQRLNPRQFERTDYYLKLPGVSNLGLKIREAKKDDGVNWTGKLEAKVLTRDLGTLKMENGSTGTANEWTKFSFQLIDGEPNLAKILDSFLPGNSSHAEKECWIKMEKNRLMVIYDQQQKNFVTNETIITEGCGIELTAISINDEVEHSFAFESFSSSGKHEENFFEAVNLFFSEVRLPALPGNRSFGYPTFLLEKISNKPVND